MTLLHSNIRYKATIDTTTAITDFSTVYFSYTSYPKQQIDGEVYELRGMGIIDGALKAIFLNTAYPQDRTKDITHTVNNTNFPSLLIFNFFLNVDTFVSDGTMAYISVSQCTITYSGNAKDAWNGYSDNPINPVVNYGTSYSDYLNFSNVEQIAPSEKDYFNVTVTMGGVDITDTVFEFDDETRQFGTLLIDIITDDVTINVEYVDAPSIVADGLFIRSDILGSYYRGQIAVIGGFTTTSPNRSIDFSSYRITLDGVDVTHLYPIGSTITLNGHYIIYLSLVRDGTLNILDKNDNIIASIANRPLGLTTHISFTKSGNDYTLTLNQFYDDVMHIVGSVTFTYANNLLGLGNIGEYNEIVVPVDTVDALFESSRFDGNGEVHVIEEDTSVVTNFSLTLYQNKSDDKVVYKDITPVGVATGVIRTVNGTNVLNLIVDIERSAIIDFNYVYIPILKRYYYVTTYDIMNKDIYRLHLSVDVLMSYKDDIASQQVMVLRNEFEFDDTLSDSEIPYSEVIEHEIVEVGNQDVSPFVLKNTPDKCDVILTVLGDVE